MASKLMHIFLLMIIMLKEGQVVLCGEDENSPPECPYPCLPPPIPGTVSYSPPTRPVVVLPPTPPSSSGNYSSTPPPPGFYYFSPPDGGFTANYPPPSFVYSNAPPPPNPILPYFPFYYKFSPPPPGVFSAARLKRSTDAMSLSLIFVLLVKLMM
ncbi:hypothetical protein MKX01_004904 [Papaver californicum]|nr:hypothetical protein MKX01_004904 [Papaver californicum]